VPSKPSSSFILSENWNEPDWIHIDNCSITVLRLYSPTIRILLAFVIPLNVIKAIQIISMIICRTDWNISGKINIIAETSSDASYLVRRTISICFNCIPTIDFPAYL
jgi:hypothetical protein